MKVSLFLIALGAVTIFTAGCGGENTPKPSTQQEVTKFKGNPKAPALQQALKAGFEAAARSNSPKPAGQ
jgi:hypothetical protein